MMLNKYWINHHATQTKNLRWRYTNSPYDLIIPFSFGADLPPLTHQIIQTRNDWLLYLLLYYAHAHTCTHTRHNPVSRATGEMLAE